MNPSAMGASSDGHAVSWLKTLKSRVRTFLKVEGGAAAIFFALSSPVWLGGLALGAEVGFWLYAEQKLQGTADAVAYSLAARIGTGPSQTELNDLAGEFLSKNQFDFLHGSWDVALTTPPEASVFVSGSTVNVRLTRNVTRYLSGIFLPGDFVIQVNAAAQVNEATEGCVLALGLSSESVGLDVMDGSNIQLSGCEALSNGARFAVWRGARLEADCARSAINFGIFGNLDVRCPRGPAIDAGFTLDPYFRLDDPQAETRVCNESMTIDASDWTGVTSFSRNGRIYVPFCLNASLVLSGVGPITIPRGYTFIFNGGQFEIDDVSVGGEDVSFYFVGGASANIFAPNHAVTLATTDDAGMLFRGAKVDPLSAETRNRIVVGPGSDLQGAIYFPASSVQFQASGRFDGCPQIIGRAVVLQGTWQMNGPCRAPGISHIVAARTTDLTH